MFCRLLLPVPKFHSGQLNGKDSVPTEWKNGEIIKLPTEGNLTQYVEHIEEFSCISASQQRPGFHTDRSKAHICTGYIKIELADECQACHAFDSLERNVMWADLSSLGLPDKLLHINFDTSAMLCEAYGRAASFAYYLFRLAIDWVMTKVKHSPQEVLASNFAPFCPITCCHPGRNHFKRPFFCCVFLDFCITFF